MSVAIEFPGTAVTVSANTNNASCVATLPAPAAGYLQYLDGFIVSTNTIAATTSVVLTITNIAGGGVAVDLTAGPAGGILLAYNFAVGWPASATATSIVLTLGALATDMRVIAFGHNVPV